MTTWRALGVAAVLLWQHFGTKRCRGGTRCNARARHLKYIFCGYLKHVDAHIQETIILHKIVMHIEIEASVIFHRAWSNILHNGTPYIFMHIYNIIAVTIVQSCIADGILWLVL
jgi:hypothetical protein